MIWGRGNPDENPGNPQVYLVLAIPLRLSEISYMNDTFLIDVVPLSQRALSTAVFLDISCLVSTKLVVTDDDPP